MNNQDAKVIDELNRRLENAMDNDQAEEYEVLKSFYDWYVEEFIY